MNPPIIIPNIAVLPAIIDRLGDTKDTVRKEAASLIQVLMSYVKSPKVIIHCFTTMYLPENAVFTRTPPDLLMA